MMYHSRHLLKQMALAQRNGMRHVSLAAQRVYLIPTANQGFFIMNNNNKIDN